jgi:hypothetical protein
MQEEQKKQFPYPVDQSQLNAGHRGSTWQRAVVRERQRTKAPRVRGTSSAVDLSMSTVQIARCVEFVGAMSRLGGLSGYPSVCM